MRRLSFGVCFLFAVLALWNVVSGCGQVSAVSPDETKGETASPPAGTCGPVVTGDGPAIAASDPRAANKVHFEFCGA
jgi:hypothetical protein